MLKRTQQLTASAKRPSFSLHLIPLLIKNETQINTKHDTIAGTLGEDTRVTSFLDFTFLKNETEKIILKRPDLETNFFFLIPVVTVQIVASKQNWYYYRKRWENDFTPLLDERHMEHET